MTTLVDTNVVLDVMLARGQFLADSSAVLAAIETSQCRGLLCASAITTIFYIARRHLGATASLARISDLLSIFEIAPVNRTVLMSALTRNFTDFEDAVLHDAALQANADCIVTRNLSDFRSALIPVYSPAQFTEALKLSESDD